MDILNWMKNSTPEECRLLAQELLELGTKPRTAEWHANVDTAIALQPRSPEEKSLKEIYEWLQIKQPVLDYMYRDGLTHSQLLEAELIRRGDDRDIYKYLQDAMDQVRIDYESDIYEALQAFIEEDRGLRRR